MFDQLSDKILSSLKKISGQSRITESNIESVVKEIRMSLLEADVHFKVVKNFIDNIKAKALGAEVLKSLTAGQQFVKIVHEELIEVLGKEAVELNVRGQPGLIYLVGLQGAGKTTSAAKLSLYIRQKLGKKPGLVSVDVYRPAAIDQLKTLGKQNQVAVYNGSENFVIDGEPQSPQEILLSAQKWAHDEMIEVVIVDTAGRLQIDDQLMEELSLLKKVWEPKEVLLVADAMLGQQSVQVAEGFHSRIGLTGLVLTKVDGDARGGAALSIRQSTGVPIKFLGVGEKVSALEVFHPDRLASRILDMGDVLSLVEKAQEIIDEKTARESAQKIASNKFTMDDFLKQIQMLKKLGSMEGMLKMLPGMGQAMKKMKDMTPPDQEIKRIEAIIRSMTPQERENHKILNGSRRLRIAKGSGTEVSEVNKFVKQFEGAQKMMSQMFKMGFGKGGRGGSKMGFPF